MLTSLDLIIAGFHEPVFPPQDKATHTEAMIATMASGAVHIISHPGNPKYPLISRRLPRGGKIPGGAGNQQLILRRRVWAVKITAGRLPPPCAMPEVGWRWARIRIPHLRSASSKSVVRSSMM
jgi:hypothetical protein